MGSVKAGPLAPYFGRRPRREARLHAHLVREHRRGRPLAAIIDDPYVVRCGGRQLLWRVLTDPTTLAQLGRNDLAAIRESRPTRD
jgi:hypothetical protein